MCSLKPIQSLAVFAWTCLAVSCAGQIAVYVESPTPLQDIAKVIGARFNVPVTYEGTLYVSTDAPRPCYSLLIDYDETTSIDSVLESAVDEYESLSGTVYVVKKFGETYSLVPASIREDGTQHDVSNLLDSKVTVDDAHITCGQVLQDLCKQLSFEYPFYSSRLLTRIPYDSALHGNIRRTEKTKRQGTGREILNIVLQKLNEEYRFASIRPYYYGGKEEVRFASWNFLPFQLPAHLGQDTKHMLSFEMRTCDSVLAKKNLMRISTVRPIASAARFVHNKYPIDVTYEEPECEFARHFDGQLGTKSCAMRGSLLELHWDANDAPGRILDQIVKARVRRAGELTLVKEADSLFHIVPIQRLDAENKVVKCESKIANDVDLREMEGTFRNVVGECLSRAFGTEVPVVGNAKILETKCKLEGGQKSVRDAIEECRSQVSSSTWQILFNPKSKKHELHVSATKP